MAGVSLPQGPLLCDRVRIVSSKRRECRGDPEDWVVRKDAGAMGNCTMELRLTWSIHWYRRPQATKRYMM